MSNIYNQFLKVFLYFFIPLNLILFSLVSYELNNINLIFWYLILSVISNFFLIYSLLLFNSFYSIIISLFLWLGFYFTFSITNILGKYESFLVINYFKLLSNDQLIETFKVSLIGISGFLTVILINKKQMITVKYTTLKKKYLNWVLNNNNLILFYFFLINIIICYINYSFSIYQSIIIPENGIIYNLFAYYFQFFFILPILFLIQITNKKNSLEIDYKYFNIFFLILSLASFSTLSRSANIISVFYIIFFLFYLNRKLFSKKRFLFLLLTILIINIFTFAGVNNLRDGIKEEFRENNKIHKLHLKKKFNNNFSIDDSILVNISDLLTKRFLGINEIAMIVSSKNEKNKTFFETIKKTI